MAKSIYEILNDLNTTTSVPDFGSEIEHTIPRELLPTAEQFENADDLLAWAQDNNCVHSCLQKGVQKFLIEIRATFKGCKKDDDWSEDYGQANVDKMEWSVTNRPNSGSSKVKLEAKLEAGLELAQTMKDNEQQQDFIIKMLTPTYGDDGAQAIIDALT